MNRKHPTRLTDAVYEFYRPRGFVEVEYVFFHGLCFTEFKKVYETTWEVEDERICLLRDVIPKEFPRARVLAVSYDSCAKVSDTGGRMNFRLLGESLVDHLIQVARVGQRGCPVVLVGYCLGGLVIKQLCMEAARQVDHAQDGLSQGRLDQFLTNLKAVKFIDTPHQGSRLEEYLRKEHGCDGPVLEYLALSGGLTTVLNEEFRRLATVKGWMLFSWWYIYATRTWDSINIPEMQVVKESSARIFSGEFQLLHSGHSGKAVEMYDHWEYNMLSRCVREIIETKEIPRLNQSKSVFEFYRPRGLTDGMKMEFVIFHGLCLSEYRDAYKQTWKMEDGSGYWIREFISDEFPEARVLAVSYDSRAKVPNRENPKSFNELGGLLVNKIIHAARVGQRGCPVVLVGYCLGAPIVKQVCIEADRQSVLAGYGDSKCRLDKFLLNVRGIMFLDTPYSGSSLAANLVEIEECNGLVLEYLNDSSAVSKQLNSDFDSLVQARRRERSCSWYCENKLIRGSVSHPDIQEVRKDCEGQGQGHFFSVCADLSRSALTSRFDISMKSFLVDLFKEPSEDALRPTVDCVHRRWVGGEYSNMNVKRKKDRGIAIIIVTEKGRPGGKVDWIRLQDMALRTNFKPFVIRNEEGRKDHDIRSSVELLLDEQLRADDECVLCCVSAHGSVTDGIQLISDDGGNSIQLVSDILKPIADHRLLVGKPKVFVINCCRVTDYVASTSLHSEPNDLEGIEDCLLMYSTEFGRVAKRAENGNEEGSIFVTELTECMSELDQTRDVESIFEEVQDRVAEVSYERTVQAKEQQKRSKCERQRKECHKREEAEAERADLAESVDFQRPVVLSSLRRRLYWLAR